MEPLKVSYIFKEKMIPVYYSDNKVKYFDGKVSFLINEEGKKVSRFYPNLSPLGVEGYYRVLYNFKNKNRKMITLAKLLKVTTDENGKVLPLEEKWVLEDFYQYIRNSSLHTVLVEKNGYFSYIDIDEQSPYYGKLLFPLIFSYATAFELEYPSLAKVHLSYKRGYIFRPTKPITSLSELNLIPKETIKELIGDVDFEDENAQSLIRSLINHNLKK